MEANVEKNFVNDFPIADIAKKISKRERQVFNMIGNGISIDQIGK